MALNLQLCLSLKLKDNPTHTRFFTRLLTSLNPQCESWSLWQQRERSFSGSKVGESDLRNSLLITKTRKTRALGHVCRMLLTETHSVVPATRLNPKYWFILCMTWQLNLNGHTDNILWATLLLTEFMSSESVYCVYEMWASNEICPKAWHHLMTVRDTEEQMCTLKRKSNILSSSLSCFVTWRLRFRRDHSQSLRGRERWTRAIWRLLELLLGCYG